MELLLCNGYMKIDTKAKTRVGDSALFLVLTGYCQNASAIIVKKLVEYDPDLVEMADARGFTPLQAASRYVVNEKKHLSTKSDQKLSDGNNLTW